MRKSGVLDAIQLQQPSCFNQPRFLTPACVPNIYQSFRPKPGELFTEARVELLAWLMVRLEDLLLVWGQMSYFESPL